MIMFGFTSESFSELQPARIGAIAPARTEILRALTAFMIFIALSV